MLTYSILYRGVLRQQVVTARLPVRQTRFVIMHVTKTVRGVFTIFDSLGIVGRTKLL